MAGVSTMFAPSYPGHQESMRLWNFAGMFNYLSGDKTSSDFGGQDGTKALADLAPPSTPSHSPLTPPTSTSSASSFPTRSPTLMDDGDLLNGTSVCCRVCRKKFANVHRLQRHMISHNESDVLRRFKCDECGKAFKFKHHLKEHKRIHSGEKPFECDHCGKRFSHSGSYSSHMSSKKCQLGRSRGTGNFASRTSPHYPGASKRHVPAPPSSSYMSVLPKGESPTPSDLGYSSPTRPIPQESLLLSPPSLVSPGGLSGVPLGTRPGFTTPLSHTLHPSLAGPLSQGLHPGLSPYHPFNSLILAAQLQPQYSLLSFLSSKKERENLSEVVKPEPQRDFSEDEDREPGELVIKEETRPEDEDEQDGDDESPRKRRVLDPPASTSSYPDTLRRVLDTVNSSVTKMKFEEVVSQAASNSSLFRAPAGVSIPVSHEEPKCRLCGAWFSTHLEALQHTRFYCPRLAEFSSLQESYKGQLIEGLAARLYKEAKEAGARQMSADILSKSQSSLFLPEIPKPAVVSESCNIRDENSSAEFDYANNVVDEEETTSDGKKVRVRSHIREDQLSILRAHYSVNPRPKKDELQTIADKVDFPVRVVQVWFQNARARDRREGRCLTPNNTLPYVTPVSLLHSPASSYSSVSSLKPPTTPNFHTITGGENYDFFEAESSSTSTPEDELKPLDLSTRKSFSIPSPKHGSNSDSDESASLAISYKSESRSPSPSSVSSNNNVFEGKDSVTLQGEQSRLALLLSGPRSSLLSSYAETSEIREKRQREDDISGDEVRKRRREEEVSGIFPCDQCDKSFSKQSSLARHKYEHSGMRPYKCNLCPKAFKHKHHLIEHSRLHTGEKPYQCLKCLKRFSHSGSYSQHMNHRFSYCKPFASSGPPSGDSVYTQDLSTSVSPPPPTRVGNVGSATPVGMSLPSSPRLTTSTPAVVSPRSANSSPEKDIDTPSVDLSSPSCPAMGVNSISVSPNHRNTVRTQSVPPNHENNDESPTKSVLPSASSHHSSSKDDTVVSATISDSSCAGRGSPEGGISSKSTIRGHSVMSAEKTNGTGNKASNISSPKADNKHENEPEDGNSAQSN